MLRAMQENPTCCKRSSSCLIPGHRGREFSISLLNGVHNPFLMVTPASETFYSPLVTGRHRTEATEKTSHSPSVHSGRRVALSRAER
jgi:hypothetical protein